MNAPLADLKKSGSQNSSSTNTGVHATAWRRPFDRWHDPYQQFFIDGFRNAQDAGAITLSVADIGRHPEALAQLVRFRENRIGARILSRVPGASLLFNKLARGLEGPPKTPSGIFEGIVGQYEFVVDGTLVKVCIDGHDSGDIVSPQLLEWCDIYYKTNYWAERDYPAKVFPEVTGNPNIGKERERLHALRNQPPIYDVCAVLRVWGGRNEIEGIEHNLRILEALSELPCKKYLMAYLVAGDRHAHAERLTKRGIPWTMKPLPLSTLWEVSAQSKLTVIRLGMHHCIPWRLIELLSSGCGTVLDRSPFSQWPVPLEENVHYAQLGLSTTPDEPVLSQERYDTIPNQVSSLLQTGAYERLRKNSAAYFDAAGSPGATALRIIEHVKKVATVKAGR